MHASQHLAKPAEWCYSTQAAHQKTQSFPVQLMGLYLAAKQVQLALAGLFFVMFPCGPFSFQQLTPGCCSSPGGPCCSPLMMGGINPSHWKGLRMPLPLTAWLACAPAPTEQAKQAKVCQCQTVTAGAQNWQALCSTFWRPVAQSLVESMRCAGRQCMRLLPCPVALGGGEGLPIRPGILPRRSLLTSSPRVARGGVTSSAAMASAAEAVTPAAVGTLSWISDQCHVAFGHYTGCATVLHAALQMHHCSSCSKQP